MNLIVNLTRPEDYQQDQGARFQVTFDTCRGAYGTAVAPFLAHLTPEGWQTATVDGDNRQGVEDKLLEYVRLADAAGERVKSATAAINRAKVRRADGLAAWTELRKRGRLVEHPDGGWCVA